MLSVGTGVSSTCSGLTRRDFLRIGGLGGLGLTLADLNPLAAAPAGGERSVIMLLLVRGPSPLETWDPKPHAPPQIRRPFGSIPTAPPRPRTSPHLPPPA